MAIMRDLLDLRQAFAAGVHSLIHKPTSSVQMERCLRAAYCATVARRRKQHRELVRILATVSTPMQPFTEAIIVNLSEGGLGLQTDPGNDFARLVLNAGGKETFVLRCRAAGRFSIRREGWFGQRCTPAESGSSTFPRTSEWPWSSG